MSGVHFAGAVKPFPANDAISQSSFCGAAGPAPRFMPPKPALLTKSFDVPCTSVGGVPADVGGVVGTAGGTSKGGPHFAVPGL